MHEDPKTTVQADVEKIVQSGIAIADRVSGLVSRATVRAQESGQDLVSVARSTVAGAVKAVHEKAGSDQEEAIRQVISGLGQGLSQAALTARLAIEEARSEGRSFADSELKKMRTDLETLSQLYGETLSEGMKGLGRLTRDEVARLRDHASMAADRLKPAVSAAIDAVREDPVGSTAGAARAGTDAVRKGTGSLFTAVGAFLSELGEKMSRS